MKAKAMLPTPADQENPARMLRGKLFGVAEKMYFWVNVCNNEGINRKFRKCFYKK